MNEIVFKNIIHEDEIDVLLDYKSTIAGFFYAYDRDTIDLLKRNFHHEDSLYLIMWQGEHFWAFVSTDTDWWESNCYFLREIFVNPVFQGMWIGKKLVEICIDHARKHNAVAVVTETAFENIAMQKLCESLGFRRWDNPKWKEGITYKLTLS